METQSWRPHVGIAELGQDNLYHLGSNGLEPITMVLVEFRRGRPAQKRLALGRAIVDACSSCSVCLAVRSWSSSHACLTAGRFERRTRRLVNPNGAPVSLTKKRICLAARVSQSATTVPHAGDASSSNASQRGHFRPKHRCPSLAFSTQAGDRPECATCNRDGARRWLYDTIVCHQKLNR